MSRPPVNETTYQRNTVNNGLIDFTDSSFSNPLKPTESPMNMGSTANLSGYTYQPNFTNMNTVTGLQNGMQQQNLPQVGMPQQSLQQPGMMMQQPAMPQPNMMMQQPAMPGVSPVMMPNVYAPSPSTSMPLPMQMPMPMPVNVSGMMPMMQGGQVYGPAMPHHYAMTNSPAVVEAGQPCELRYQGTVYKKADAVPVVSQPALPTPSPVCMAAEPVQTMTSQANPEAPNIHTRIMQKVEECMIKENAKNKVGGKMGRNMTSSGMAYPSTSVEAFDFKKELRKFNQRMGSNVGKGSKR